MRKLVSAFIVLLTLLNPILGAQPVLAQNSGGSAVAPIWPGVHWQTATPEEVGMDASKLAQAREYALTGGGSGYIIRHGHLVMSWGSPSETYDLKSASKSIGVSALGLAIKDGKLSLDDKVQQHYPGFGLPPDSNAGTGWLDDITPLQLATQTAGFDKPGDYIDLLYPPGTHWAYSDGGPNWLADALTTVYGEDLNSLLFRRVFTPIGIAASDLDWRDNLYRSDTLDAIKRREFGGISADVDAMARIGYLYLRNGAWNNQEVLPRAFVEQARSTVPGVLGLPERDPANDCDASEHYGLLWWNNADGAIPNLPRDAFFAWGLYESLIVVIPSLDIVAARAGEAGWQTGWSSCYEVLAPFLEPVAQSVFNRVYIPLINKEP